MSFAQPVPLAFSKRCPYTPAELLFYPFVPSLSASKKCQCLLPAIQSIPPPQSKYVIYDDSKFSHISQVSFGETGGLYPTKNAASVGLYSPEKWDEQMVGEILKCRAALTLVATRGERCKKSLPNTKNKVERMLTTYHITDNFPEVDQEIKANAAVKFFYLSPDANAKHTALDYKIWDIKMVKSYGPFYNAGGGDVPRGATYVLFYAVTKKVSK